MEKKCIRCRKMFPESEFAFHKNGRQYKLCSSCVEKQRKINQVLAEERRARDFTKPKPEKPKKKKLNFEKEMKKIAATGMSYREYQIAETKRLMRMERQKDEE